jgi:hypothetical protein
MKRRSLLKPSRGRKYNDTKRMGIVFIVLVVICLLSFSKPRQSIDHFPDVGNMIEPVEAKTIDHIVEPNKMIEVARNVVIDHIQQPTKMMETPFDYNSANGKQRLGALVDEMAKGPLTNEQINLMRVVARYESCRDINVADCLSLTKTPQTWVQHCKNPNGKWKIVPEDYDPKCPVDYITGMREKSWGPFQILETTWAGNKCEGDVKSATYQQHVHCMEKIVLKSGIKGQWSSYSLAVANKDNY